MNKGSDSNITHVFCHSELVGYLNHYAFENNDIPHARFFELLLLDYVKEHFIEDHSITKFNKLRKELLTPRAKITAKNKKAKIKLENLAKIQKRMQKMIEDLQQQSKQKSEKNLEVERMNAENFAKQTEIAKENMKLKKQKDVMKQQYIESLNSQYKILKEKILDEMVDFYTEHAECIQFVKSHYWWDLENVICSLEKEQILVENVTEDELKQHPLVTKAIEDRKIRKEKRLAEMEKQQQIEKARLEKLKKENYPEWLKIQLKEHNLDFEETETEIKIKDYSIEEHNFNAYNKINDKDLEALGLKFVNQFNTHKDYWCYAK